MSRLSIDLPQDFHKMLRAVAALDGKNIKEFVMEQLMHHPMLAKHAPLEISKNERKMSKKAEQRLQTAIKETMDKKHSLKSYKTAKELFDEYR